MEGPILLYELISNHNRTFAYSINRYSKNYKFRFDLSLTKGKDSRVYILGEDNRWILMLEDNYYERLSNEPNKVQLDKIKEGQMTKEIVEKYNDEQRLQRRNERLMHYFTCLDKLL